MPVIIDKRAEATWLDPVVLVAILPPALP